MENLKKIITGLFVAILFSFSCSSLYVIREPVLERTTVQSGPVCFSLFSFCHEGSSNSVIIKGVVENNSGIKNYYLIYNLKNFETEFPVGVSLNLDGLYYNLKKTSTDYSEYVSVSSELSSDFLDKILSSKKISLSYSNRTDTINIDFSGREHRNFLKNIQKVKESLFSAEKLNIVK